MPPDWTREEDYAWIAELDASGLAWEFLRRNPRYRETFEEKGDLEPFGLRFALDPALSAREVDPVWRWEVASSISVLFAPAPSSGATTQRLLQAAIWRRAAEEGLHLRFPGGLQAVLPPRLSSEQALGAVLPFDRDLASRLLAAHDLARGLAGRWAPAGRVPRGRRMRLQRALRALDGLAQGASYRDIAEQVLGAQSTVSLAWRTSSARALAIRLCVFGRTLARSGYAGLVGRART